LTIYPYN